MATETTQQLTPAAQFHQAFTKMESQFSLALPKHMPVERFMRVVLTAVNGNPDLLNADRQSLFESAMKGPLQRPGNRI
jgi:recombination protein RecT